MEYYSPPLPNVAFPQETARIELRSCPQVMETEKCWENIFPKWILHPHAIIQTNESPPNMATPKSLLPPQASEMKVG